MYEHTDVYPYRREQNGVKKKKLQKNKRKDAVGATQMLAGKIWRYFATAFSLEGFWVAVAAFFLGRTIILGELTPFGPAFLVAVVAVWRSYVPLVLGAACVSLFTVLHGVGAWGHFFVLVFLTLVCYLYPVNYQRRWLVVPGMVFVTIVLVKGIFALFFEPTLYRWVAIAFEGAFAGALAAAFMMILGAFSSSRDIWSISPEESLCLIVLLLGVLGGMEDIRVFSLALHRLAGNFLVMLVALGGGAGAGAAAGTLVGAIPSITQIAAPSLVGVLALAGLLAGLFNSYGRLGVIAGYILGNLIFSVYLLDQNAVILRFVEIGISCVAMALVSGPWQTRLRTLFASGSDGLVHKQLANISSKKVRDLAQIFAELARSFSETSTAAEAEKKEPGRDKAANIVNLIAQKVCHRCPAANKCWETDFYATYKSLLKLFSMAENKGRIAKKDVTTSMRGQCTRKGEIATAVNFLLETYHVDKFWRQRVRESKELLSQQLEGISHIMDDLVNSLTLEVEKRGDLEAVLARELSRVGIDYYELSVYRCGRRDLEINLKLKPCTSGAYCAKTVIPAVSRVMGRPYAEDSRSCLERAGGSSCYVRLIPAWAYHVEAGFAQAAKKGAAICGDRAAILKLKDGKMALLISDGMGVGVKAARESNMTVNLLHQLLEAGFELELAVKTLNSIMTIRTLEDSFTTLDLALIDLYTGAGEFVKIGAMPSWIKRGHQVESIAAGNLPIGILASIEVESLSKQLQLGDLLVMVSDGVQEKEQDQWLLQAIRDLKTDDPQEAANRLLESALDRRGGSAQDDITVLAARIDRKLPPL